MDEGDYPEGYPMEDERGMRMGRMPGRGGPGGGRLVGGRGVRRARPAIAGGLQRTRGGGVRPRGKRSNGSDDEYGMGPEDTGACKALFRASLS
jgi:hypothetical protein